MPLLMSVMTEFYAESGYELNRPLVAGPAQTVYRRVGFVEAADRQLLALALANPAHAV